MAAPRRKHVPVCSRYFLKGSALCVMISSKALAAVVPSGQGIGSWQACHEFESSTTKDPPSDTGHGMGERNVHCDPTLWDGETVISERCVTK
ncbi:hypothetical protein TNCV_236101 [Trichonephila clavipes]|nr:hypothetical protein TNCV_236101 [Trichonephila clavipes]